MRSSLLKQLLYSGIMIRCCPVLWLLPVIWWCPHIAVRTRLCCELLFSWKMHTFSAVHLRRSRLRVEVESGLHHSLQYLTIGWRDLKSEILQWKSQFSAIINQDTGSSSLPVKRCKWNCSVISSDYIDNLVIFWGINHKFVIRLIFVQVATLGKNMNTHEWVYTQGDLPCVQKWLGLWVATHVPHSSWGSHVHINTSEPPRRPVHPPSASFRQIPWW